MELIIHISSDCVSAVLNDSKVTPKISIGVTRVFPSHKNENNHQFFGPTIMDVVQGVLKLAHARFPGRRTHISSVVCIIGAPWIEVCGKIIALRTEQPFVLTSKFLHSVTEIEADRLSREHFDKDSTIILEKAIFGATIRGYLIKDPENQSTNQCDLSFFTSVVPKNFIELVSQTIHDAIRFPAPKVVFQSAVFVVYSKFRAKLPTEFQVSTTLMINVSGEITDLLLISAGMLRGVTSFSCGRNIFARQVAKALDVPFVVARSIVQTQKDGRLGDAMRAAVEPLLDQAAKEWLAYFRSSAATLGDVPAKALLVVDKSYQEFFPEVLKSIGIVILTLEESLIDMCLQQSFIKN